MVDPWLQPVHFLVDCVDHYQSGDSRHVRCGLRLPGYRPHLTDPPWASLSPNVRAAGICAGIRLLNQSCYVSVGIRVPAGRDVLMPGSFSQIQTHSTFGADFRSCRCAIRDCNFSSEGTTHDWDERRHYLCSLYRRCRSVVPRRWRDVRWLGGRVC